MLFDKNASRGQRYKREFWDHPFEDQLGMLSKSTFYRGKDFMTHLMNNVPYTE